jgi:hypothetical protein
MFIVYLTRYERSRQKVFEEFLSGPGNAWGESRGTIHAMPHEFRTGSTGFYGTGKIVNPENPKARYQVCVNITLIGSKLHDRRD